MTGLAASAQGAPVPDLLQDVAGLAAHLRSLDFAIGLRDELRLLALRDALAASGQLPRALDALRRTIAPLVCRNPDEQARLGDALALWPPLREGADAPPVASPLERAVETLNRRRRWAWILPALAALVLVGALWLWLRPPPPPPPTVAPAPVEAPVATPGGRAPAAAPPSAPPPSLPLGWKIVLGLAPLGGAAAFWLGRRRTPVLERGLAPRNARQEALDVAAVDSPLLRPSAVRLPLRDLRRHRLIPSSDLDTARTVAATVACGGFVRLVHGRRPVTPDYLLLADRAARDDHLAALADVLAARLRVEQVRVSHGEFRGDPRVVSLIGPDGSRRRTDLARLAAEAGETRLLLLADIAGFWDAARGAWRSWVADLAAFEAPVVLTLAPRETWGPRERDLMAMGFEIAPATADGLADLAERVAADGARPRPTPAIGGKAARLDALLAVDPYRWSADAPPTTGDIDALIGALRGNLGAAAYLHLCAIAVFPALHPRLTEEIGAALTTGAGQPVLSDAGFAALARLPWLRRGRLPDWLRKALIDSMPADDKDRVRRVWTRALEPAPEGRRSGLAFAYVRDPGIEADIRRALARLMRAVDAPDLKEAILLAFLEGRDLPDLALAAPDRLDEGRPFAWPRPDRLDVGFAVLALALGVGLALAADSLVILARQAAATATSYVTTLVSPLAVVGAHLLKAIDRPAGRERRLRSVAVGLLTVVAGLDCALTAANGTFSLAIAQGMAAAGAAACAFLPKGFRSLTPPNLDWRRLFSGDDWRLTTAVILSLTVPLFWSIAASEAALIGAAPAVLEWTGPFAWPYAVATASVCCGLAAIYFGPRLGLSAWYPARGAALAAIMVTTIGVVASAAPALAVTAKTPPNASDILSDMIYAFSINAIVSFFILTMNFNFSKTRRSKTALALLVNIGLCISNPILLIFICGILAIVLTPITSGASGGGMIVVYIVICFFSPITMIHSTLFLLKRSQKQRLFTLLSYVLSVLLLSICLIFSIGNSTNTIYSPNFSFRIAYALGYWAFPLTLAWPSLRWSAPELWRGAPAAARPAVAFDPWLASVFALSLTWRLSGSASLDLTPLLVPLTAWITLRKGWAGARNAVLFGAAPLLAKISFGPVATAGDPGLYVGLILLARLLSDNRYLPRWLETTRLTPWQIGLLIVPLGTYLSLHLGQDPALEIRWQVFALQDLLFLLVGLSRAPVRGLIFAVVGCVPPAILFALTPRWDIGPEDLRLSAIGAMALPSQIATTCAFLAVGRALRSWSPLLSDRDSGGTKSNLMQSLVTARTLAFDVVVVLSLVELRIPGIGGALGQGFPLVASLGLIPIAVEIGLAQGARARLSVLFGSAAVAAAGAGLIGYVSTFQSVVVLQDPMRLLCEFGPCWLAAVGALELAIQCREGRFGVLELTTRRAGPTFGRWSAVT
jgi:hypothetical protein